MSRQRGACTGCAPVLVVWAGLPQGSDGYGSIVVRPYLLAYHGAELPEGTLVDGYPCSSMLEVLVHLLAHEVVHALVGPFWMHTPACRGPGTLGASTAGCSGTWCRTSLGTRGAAVSGAARAGRASRRRMCGWLTPAVRRWQGCSTGGRRVWKQPWREGLVVG